MHLVLRVQTDDALKLETQTTADRLAEQLKTANIPVGGVTVDERDVVHRHRRAARSGCGVPQRADRGRGQLRPLDRSGGSYTFTLQAEHRRPAPRRHRQPGAADDRAPRQRARRRRADRRAPQRRRSDPGAAAGRDRRGPRQGDHPIDRAARVEAGRAGAVLRRERGAPAFGGNVPPDMQLLPGTIEAATRTAGEHRLLRRAPRARGDRTRSAQRAADARREQPPGGELLAEPGGRAQVRQLHAGQHRPPAWHRARQPRPVGAGHPVAHRR